MWHPGTSRHPQMCTFGTLVGANGTLKEQNKKVSAAMYPDESDLFKFVMCTLVFRVHKTFYTLRKGFTIPGNQGPHDKLQIR